MARISVWFVRAALVYFAVGATAGAWGLAAKSSLWLSLSLPIRPFHVEVMLIGWVCQLAVGVALWILPFSRSVSQDQRFWAAWALLNGGVGLVVVARWTDLHGLLVGGRICELIAGGLLVWGLWPRLRAVARHRH